jgi:hypothetical protein
MKKLMYAVGIGLMLGSGFVIASNVGPYAYDEKGAQVTTGLGIAGVTVATMNALTPAYAGEMIFITNATQSQVCISSGTTTGGWVVLVATGVFTAATYPHCQ